MPNRVCNLENHQISIRPGQYFFLEKMNKYYDRNKCFQTTIHGNKLYIERMQGFNFGRRVNFYVIIHNQNGQCQ